MNNEKKHDRRFVISGKVVLASVLVLAIVAVCFTASLQYEDGKTAAERFEHADYSFQIGTDDTVKIMDYYGNVPNLVIPSKVEFKGINYDVVSIAKNAFKGHTEIVSLVIPDSVTSIESFSFKECKNITYLSIPISVDASVDPINQAFRGCENIKEIDITPGTSIGHDYELTVFTGQGKVGPEYPRTPWVLASDKLESVTLSEGITHIGDYMFYGAKLKSIVIPDSVTSVGRNVFKGCATLTDITAPINIPLHCNESGILYKCDNIEHVLFTKGTGAGASYHYAKGPWHNNEKMEVNIPEGIEIIGDYMFDFCPQMRSLVLPSSLKEIGNNAFGNCKNLESVTFNDSLTHIGKQAFTMCPKLSSVTLPDSLESIGAYAFMYCGIKEISVPISVDLRGERLCNPFFQCFSVEKITLTPGTGHAFNYDELYKKTVWQTTKAPLTLSIADGVQSIGKNMFRECENLTEISIPDSVREIRDGAFQNCLNLNTIEFGTGLEYVSTTAFYGFTFYNTEGSNFVHEASVLKGKTFKGGSGILICQ